MGVRKQRLSMWLLLLLPVGAGLAYAGYQHWRGPAPLTVGDGQSGPLNMVWIPAGEFLMGSNHDKAQPNERPAHRVQLDGYWVDRYDVTNADFARFVEQTGYVTTAEKKPDWEELKVQLPPGTPRPDDSLLVPGAMVFIGSERPVPLDDFSQWWAYVPGANWRHPTGPQSSIEGKALHPVVQVSYDDVQAYANWANKRLLTEAEWEYAARGGLDQATYAWGNEFAPGGEQMTNTWIEEQPFPVTNASTLFKIGTKPVASYRPNAYGLYDMSGNVWQWVADWYRSDAFKHVAGRSAKEVTVNPVGPASSYDVALGVTANAPLRVIRGGSFLCSESYCTSFRTSARQGSDPANPMSHLGFRLAMSNTQWESSK